MMVCAHLRENRDLARLPRAAPLPHGRRMHVAGQADRGLPCRCPFLWTQRLSMAAATHMVRHRPCSTNGEPLPGSGRKGQWSTVQRLPPQPGDDVVAFLGGAAGCQGPGDVPCASIGPVGRSIQGDHHGFHAFAVVGSTYDASIGYGGGNRPFAAGRPQCNVIRNHTLVSRRKTSQQFRAIPAIQLPTDRHEQFSLAHSQRRVMAA